MDNNYMNTIQKLKRVSDQYTSVLLDGEKFRGYTIGDLPNKFGCINYGESEGISSWAKPEGQGITYVAESNFPKGF
jgi:hypothetical protein